MLIYLKFRGSTVEEVFVEHEIIKHLGEGHKFELKTQEKIFGPGDRPDLYLVESGTVKVYRLVGLCDESEKAIVDICFPGELFGNMMLEKTPVIDYEAVAGQKSTLRFWKAGANNYQTILPVWRILAQETAKKLERANLLLGSMRYLLQVRLATLLVELAERGGIVSEEKWVDIDGVSYGEFAKMLGSTRENTTTSIVELRKQGLVAPLKRRRLLQVNIDGLKQFLAARL